MEEILKSVAEAEAKAEEIKRRAAERAAEIFAQSEAEAENVRKQSEAECKALRERKLNEARRQAQEDYLKALEVRRGEAQRFADSVLENIEAAAQAVAGRISRDR